DPQAALADLRDDSRQVRPGSAFIAVPGLANDGHDFLPQATAAGAALLIVDRAIFAGIGHASPVPRLELDDIARFVPELAATWYGWPGDRLRLAGITGTNGK
ncbi:MAG: hypothetical protein KC431_10725, partial [Myxococcales bacterium]|nr:hypothetical protein [Myxococcales bacterium]